jgi:hydrogenase nickel incorporation protein HypA/HybF
MLMHDMAAARRLVAESVERMRDEGADEVRDVEVVLGSTAHLSAESLREHFALAARGTPAEGAVVRVTWAPSRYWCIDCMFEYSSRAHGGGTCPRCGGAVLSIDREEPAHVRTVTAGLRRDVPEQAGAGGPAPGGDGRGRHRRPGPLVQPGRP